MQGTLPPMSQKEQLALQLKQVSIKHADHLSVVSELYHGHVWHQ